MATDKIKFHITVTVMPNIKGNSAGDQNNFTPQSQGLQMWGCRHFYSDKSGPYAFYVAQC